MEIDDPTMPGPLMQTVDVLGHEQRDQPELLQVRERPVSRAGCRPRHRGPPHEAPRPVATTLRGIADERLVPDGLTALPVATVVPVGRDAGRGGHPGPRQDDERALRGDEVGEGLDVASRPRRRRRYRDASRSWIRDPAIMLVSP